MITIIENQKEKKVTYEQLLSAHHGEMVCGVSLAYRLLSELSPIHSGPVYFYNGVGDNAEGVNDSVKYIFQKHLTLDLDKEKCATKKALAAPNGGKYYFQLISDYCCIEAMLVEGALSIEFMNLSHQVKQLGKDCPKALHQKLLDVRQAQADKLQALPFDQIFSIHNISPKESLQ
ncbi:hypothetical protein [Allofustis seminis]|uniref:hypothetical protein n=1 Tax=Allofustis seminis TaxID=166939 RepID=UPI0003736DEF|nr:hypothetical protein [Allofustis seminis]